MRDAASIASRPGHNVNGVTLMDGTYLDTARLARNALDTARQRHMLAIQRAIAAGVPMIELERDAVAFHCAVGQLMRMCGSPDGGAPMVLT